MSIPNHRLSSELKDENWLEPDNFHRAVAFWDYERGPVALNDPTMGLSYQNWTLQWNPGNGDFSVIPETVGSPSVVLNAINITQASFCFDQNGHVNITYISAGLAYLYWYDTNVNTWVVTALHPSVTSTVLSLDDKRTTQTQSSDMILWYTRNMGSGVYNLYTKEQRDRFIIEYLMAADIPPFIVRAGMNSVLRGQIGLRMGL